MMMILSILMMVLFFKVLGFAFRMGFGIMRAFFGFIGFLIVASLVLSFAGVFLLPMIGVIVLIVLLARSSDRR
jgi:hypothetical protein